MRGRGCGVDEDVVRTLLDAIDTCPRGARLAYRGAFAQALLVQDQPVPAELTLIRPFLHTELPDGMPHQPPIQAPLEEEHDGSAMRMKPKLTRENVKPSAPMAPCFTIGDLTKLLSSVMCWG
jgi:hypothetical protein